MPFCIGVCHTPPVTPHTISHFLSPHFRRVNNRYQLEVKKKLVTDFIKSSTPIQQHYSRGTKSVRQYLPSDLSIAKMWKIYNQKSTSHQVLYEYFHNIFSTNLNISFGSPRVDKCSRCTSLENRIATAIDPAEKSNLQVQHSVHNKRADVFDEILCTKVEQDVSVLSNNCQKNLGLPKVLDQAAYYSRQLYLYNFMICEGISTSLQTKTNTFCYVWTEND